MIRDLVRDIILRSIAALQETGALPGVEVPAFDVERPQTIAHGDYATNIAMKLAAALKGTGEKINPRALAERIAAHIRETVELVPAYDLISAVEVAGPGFINLRLDSAWLLRQTGEIIAAGNTLGCIERGVGQRVNLEFVSANPTGPVTVGNGRGAFIGDTLGNVLRAAGYDVTKEYYFNDGGAQILKLGCSMEHYLWLALGDTARAERVYAALPEATAEKKSPRAGKGSEAANVAAEAEDSHDSAEADEAPARKVGYFGDYYLGVAQRMLEDNGRALLDVAEADRAQAIGKAAAAVIMSDIQATMAKMRIEFDVFFNEASLVTSGAREKGIQALIESGHTTEREGALWARTSEFGDTQDWVIRRSTGEPTYLASDVAYLQNKFGRGFDRLIYVLGADHHSYIGRLKSVARMLGHDSDQVQVLLYQTVRLVVNGEPVKMGKRLGNVVTLDELYEDIGPDVTRFFYLMRSHETHLDFDLGLARRQSDENPGLSVQYAHARASGVLRKALEQGITEPDWTDADMAALLGDRPEELDRELALLRQILRMEEMVDRVAQTLEPHHLTRYAMDLADAFHLFYDNCPILKQGTEIPHETRMARLRLLRAGQAAIARALTIIGMSAPERMERETAEVVEA